MEHRFGIKALLGASIALALSFSAFAGDAPPTTTRYNVSSLSDGGHYDRFIVTYRKGASERSDHAAAAQNVQAAISRAGLAQAPLDGPCRAPSTSASWPSARTWCAPRASWTRPKRRR